ncbi:hypothetical protein GF406_19580 [candidate division KSB1 bacterium]|nr:hypothetical protein [candidate division KSB1 bacterium]
MPKKNSLKHTLETMAAQGIRSDAPKLKRDMCSQFSDTNEWIREYVVNAYDAGATTCRIYGKEEGDIQSIYVADDGRGMNSHRIRLFFTLYQSEKNDGIERPVGRHGIGKLSVAAIPEQCGFVLMTSDGHEAWRAETGSLLEEHPIDLQRIEPVPERGTTFCIKFKKKKPLAKVMSELQQVLYKYVRYLPLQIRIFIPADDESSAEQWEQIGSPWELDGAAFFQSYELDLFGSSFEVVMSLGDGTHSIYQNRVFITTKYNLLSHDLDTQWHIPYLSLRVDSPDFDLPFGRHCLSNEEMLPPLTREIRTQLLPQFLNNILPYYERSDARGNIYNIEAMIAALCLFDGRFSHPWTLWPVFRQVNGWRMSLNELGKKIRETGKLYLADEEQEGIDYEFFDGPVMAKSQPGRGLETIEKCFGARLINLQQQDLVMEAPSGTHPELTSAEQKFARSLGFHPEALKMQLQDKETAETAFSFVDKEKTRGTIKELEKAKSDLQNVNWRVSHLVERDGKTPCLRHRFLTRGEDVVLNLYHPDIKKLVKLAETVPALACHWAIAMCLVENAHILKHLSAEEREDVLLVDAMAKLSQGKPLPKQQGYKTGSSKRDELWTFIRSAMDRHSLADK